MRHEKYMEIAMNEAQEAVDKGNAPFGVVILDPNGTIVHKDHDRVRENMDPTAHGEVNSIRFLCKSLNKLSLEGYIFYTTSEPCPTCLSACIKAKVSNIYFGADTETTASLPIKAVELVKYSKKHSIKIQGGILADECLSQRNKLLNL